MIDTFYRIKALSEIGIGIHLHCFEYGREHSPETESLCHTVNYYPRRTGLSAQMSTVPYTVSSRRSKSLINNLLTDDLPILFDGLHSTFCLDHPELKNRKMLVRLHNVEHLYYKALADNEKNLIRKMFFMCEASKLRSWEKILENASYLLTISGQDQNYYKNKYDNAIMLPPFHPFTDISSKTGIGDYIIYHGDLSVNENEAMASFLVTDVFPFVPYPCVIAGKNPSSRLIARASKHKNISVISNPDNIHMNRLITDAHINLLPSISFNGFKLKLLIAMFSGRHCIVNKLVAEKTPFPGMFHVSENKKDMIDQINRLMKVPFTNTIIGERNDLLMKDFNNRTNAEKLAEFLS